MKVVWDAVGSRRYETGLDHGVLYFYDRTNYVQTGVPWNGLISVDDTTPSVDVQPYYIDGEIHLNRRRSSSYSGKISAFTYPDEFDRFNGVGSSSSGIQFYDQDISDSFGLSYRTLIGTDVKVLGAGYKLHILYNLIAVPSDRNAKTMTENVDPNTFSWDIVAKPEHFKGYRPTAHLVFDSTKISPSLLATVESILYGSDTKPPRLPTATELNRWV